MKNFHLHDYEKWKALNSNKEFSFYDYIYMVLKDKNINDDIVFAFSELFWPSFIIYDDFIFLEQNFSKSKIENIIQQGSKVEFWMNMLTIDPFFKFSELENVKCFTKKLIQAWDCKLKSEFPERKFSVELLVDEDVGDCALTFYQIEENKN